MNATLNNATLATRRGVSRLWQGYLAQLAARPLRTKMVTSGTMFFVGDAIAQFGIEGRRVSPDAVPQPDGYGPVEDDVTLAYNPTRAARQAVYGALVLAPLAHNWLVRLDKVKFANKWATLGAKVSLDQLVWGPFIVTTFWSWTGMMEGKTGDQVAELVHFAFPGAYSKCVAVFAPTQIVNFLWVPLHHRLLVHQTVGLGWNIFLSYMTNKNNTLLAAAKADLAQAQIAEASVEPIHDKAHDDERALAHAKVEDAAKVLAAVKEERQRLRDLEGGGATAAGTRM
ncbi:hypothetical protein CcaverHIS002_0210670 [Cutaneotrichosporon cavernicola]|uniref:Uncharacterized protein n=1 Tax=Cutaneotrichosporon cavernicola TaxID=279322 RepID=A0AA48L1I7_9TREE|nr:uncharacterized protein CcaverHIS019_0210670 [Cutaneotrichosporon cavernicola]BEI81907.1 hypothetical protein CcaverHIS002_0210670 [Cutaneotrichosporon cavernicola]BEI89705.1 hypothetical protein CcaverHIS019_0210670 [Cutaneotrichosporon cavernicola]BEI97476.1 hypothetical protein CcaverHIS631_0210650 [Cutaneotrichosporon cavernicola]BEJ05254.1 hypothetical protein CcaverHIS641_0210710 [Cutaneotrichosporon cavernicola]